LTQTGRTEHTVNTEHEQSILKFSDHRICIIVDNIIIFSCDYYQKKDGNDISFVSISLKVSL